MNDEKRTCLLCKHFHIAQMTAAYSEQTPGSDFEMWCEQCVWTFDARSTTEEEYRQMLLSAETCSHYQFYK